MSREDCGSIMFCFEFDADFCGHCEQLQCHVGDVSLSDAMIAKYVHHNATCSCKTVKTTLTAVLTV